MEHAGRTPTWLNQATASGTMPAPQPAASRIPATAGADPESAADIPPWKEIPVAQPAADGRRRVNPGKVRRVAGILGLADGEEDEALALKGEGSPPH